MVDLPEAGKPVIHTANAVSRFTVLVHAFQIERFIVEDVLNKRKDSAPNALGKFRIPYRARDHKATKGKEWRHDRKHFSIARSLQIPRPKPVEQRLEVAFEAATALEGEEHVVHRQATDIVGRFAPFSSGTVQNMKLSIFLKENVPGVEVPVDLSQSVRVIFQAPAPLHDLMFDVFEQRAIDKAMPLRIAVGESHDALTVSHQFPNPPRVQTRVVSLDPMYTDEVVR